MRTGCASSYKYKLRARDPVPLRYPEAVTTREEVEVKIAVSGPEHALEILGRAGFAISTPRIFEQNIVLDDPAGSIKGSNRLLRVRQAGDLITVTYKGREIDGVHKRREEREFHADNLDECIAVFSGVGLKPAYRYEKFRTEFARSGEPGHAVLDETPIGTYMELEGPPEWIDQAAADLDFTQADYILLSYMRLYLKWCDANGQTPTNMVFTRQTD